MNTQGEIVNAASKLGLDWDSALTTNGSQLKVQGCQRIFDQEFWLR